MTKSVPNDDDPGDGGSVPDGSVPDGPVLDGHEVDDRVANDRVADDGSRRARHPGRRRSWLTMSIAAFAAIALSLGIVTTWIEQTVYDSEAFADRAVALLDSKAIREELADEIADQLIANGAPQLISFRTVLVDVVTEVIGTEGFKKIFHEAVLRAHHAVFTEDGSAALLQLGQGVSLFTQTLQVSFPGVAEKLPADASTTVVDVTEHIKGMELWKQLDALDTVNEALIVVGFVSFILVVVLDPIRRMGVVKMGVAFVFAGSLVFAIAASAPRFAATFVADPTLANAVSAAVRVFVQDLTNLGLWIVLVGAITAAAASAVAPDRPPMPLRELYERARGFVEQWQPASDGGKVLRGIALVAVGGIVLLARDGLVPFAMALLGAYIAYRGVLQVLHVVGRPRGSSMLPRAATSGGAPVRHRRRIVVVAVAAVAVALTSVTAAGSVASTRNRVRVANELRCNGYSELCDRRLDEVTFAGAHNAMSAANQPGWLFAENETGIPSQLAYGIRALLVKSHYGFATGVKVGSAELVVTDTAAELQANVKGAEDELTPEELARVQQMAASAPKPTGQKEVYLCHVACELGATKFTDALADLKAFLDRNPNEVVIWFIGDFVSADDTYAAFEAANLADRLWESDASDLSAPLPTLRDLIESGKNVIVFSEHSGQPPAWNNPGYGMWQDTPYTFANPSDFSCAPNRGRKDSPLFQINHWITNTEPPSPVVAAQVNSYDVLMPAVQRCQQERGMRPNLVGVNFFGQGDLMRVVNELNGVS